MPNDKDRAEFEKWARGMPLELSDCELHRLPNDESTTAWPNCYQDYETDRLWLAWREARRPTIPVEDVRELVADLDRAVSLLIELTDADEPLTKIENLERRVNIHIRKSKATVGKAAARKVVGDE